MTYQFREGSRLRGDPAVVGETLDELRRRSGGKLRPETVVRAARPARSVLHEYFCWDDRKAAHRYRIWQAEHLIRSVVIVPDATDEARFVEVRAFVSLAPRDADDERSYMHIREVVEDAALCRQMLEQAERELAAWRRKYAALKKFAELFRLIDELVPSA